MKKDLLAITPAALEHIKTMMAKKEKAIGFRIAVKQTGCSGYMYQPEIIETKKKADDQEIEIENLKIFIDALSLPIIQGTTIDYVTKSFGFKQLQFNNPNAEGLCGCGESFHLKPEQSENG